MLKRKRGASSLRPTQAQTVAYHSGSTSRSWRRVNALLVLLTLVAGTYMAVGKMLEDQRFPLRQIYFQGELKQLSSEALRQVVAGYLGRNFFSLDILGLKQDLSAQPWVEQVTVRRLWPDSLEVHLRERQAFAYWGENELVESQGQRFRPTSIDLAKAEFTLPQLSGPDGQEQAVIATYHSASELLQAVNLRVASLSQDERGAWTLLLDNGLKILLGKDDLEGRLQRLVAVYPRTLQPQVSDIAVLDLRYQTGLAVRWTALSESQRAQAVRTAAQSNPPINYRTRSKSAG